MSRVTTTCNGHVIEAWGSDLTGKETVKYDNTIVSEKTSLGFTSTHTFFRDEGGEKINYEVEFSVSFPTAKVRIRRNGILVAHN